MLGTNSKMLFAQGDEETQLSVRPSVADQRPRSAAGTATRVLSPSPPLLLHPVAAKMLLCRGCRERKVRLDVAGIEWTQVGSSPVPFTVSIGGAAIRDCPESVSALMIQAAQCLYEAKRLGRNRIAFHPGVSDVARAMADKSLRQSCTRRLIRPEGGRFLR